MKQMLAIGTTAAYDMPRRHAAAPAAREGSKDPQPRRMRSGQALVELALLLSVFMLLLLPLLDYSRVMYISAKMASAARDGARVAMKGPTDLTAIRKAVRAAAAPYTIPDDNNIVASSNTSTKQVTVTISYSYTSVFAYVSRFWGGSRTRNMTFTRVARYP